jgi:hypothetical protein
VIFHSSNNSLLLCHVRAEISGQFHDDGLQSREIPCCWNTRTLEGRVEAISAMVVRSVMIVFARAALRSSSSVPGSSVANNATGFARVALPRLQHNSWCTTAGAVRVVLVLLVWALRGAENRFTPFRRTAVMRLCANRDMSRRRQREAGAVSMNKLIALPLVGRCGFGENPGAGRATF